MRSLFLQRYLLSALALDEAASPGAAIVQDIAEAAFTVSHLSGTTLDNLRDNGLTVLAAAIPI